MLKNSVEWRSTYKVPTPYKVAVDEMERKVSAIRDEEEPQQVWLLEHPAIYTAGSAALAVDLLDPGRFPVFKTGSRRSVYLSRPRSINCLCYAGFSQT